MLIKNLKEQLISLNRDSYYTLSIFYFPVFEYIKPHRRVLAKVLGFLNDY